MCSKTETPLRSKHLVDHTVFYAMTQRLGWKAVHMNAIEGFDFYYISIRRRKLHHLSRYRLLRIRSRHKRPPVSTAFRSAASSELLIMRRMLMGKFGWEGASWSDWADCIFPAQTLKSSYSCTSWFHSGPAAFSLFALYSQKWTCNKSKKDLLLSGQFCGRLWSIVSSSTVHSIGLQNGLKGSG